MIEIQIYIYKTLNFWKKLDNVKSSNLAQHIQDAMVR